jgi:hypothetical protein
VPGVAGGPPGGPAPPDFPVTLRFPHLVIGLPLIGAAAGWLFGGRQPPAVSRQPLE